MPGRQLKAVVHFVRGLADEGPADAELVERFARDRDEQAFAMLLRRHGPLVMGVCRRLLHQSHDAEDVFQATFLVLARKAVSIRKRGSLGSWLHGVAARLAQNARARAARRRVYEGPIVDLPITEPVAEFIWRDLRPILDEEIEGLPTKYRDAFVLCHLQGKTNEQAARELGCPLGTILSRLSRARELLRFRLNRRGVSLASGLLFAMLAEHGAAAVPITYVERTIKAAVLFAAGRGAAEAVSASAAALAEGVLRTMIVTRIVCAAVLISLVGMVGTGVYSSPQVQADKLADGQQNSDLAEKSDKRGFSGQTKKPASGQGDKVYEDADKERLRLANKLLQEEIEDEKVKIEGLNKKLERLRKSIKLPNEDAEMSRLRRENRHFQQDLLSLQNEVRLLEDDVRPYVQKLQNGAGNAGHMYEKTMAK